MERLHVKLLTPKLAKPKGFSRCSTEDNIKIALTWIFFFCGHVPASMALRSQHGWPGVFGSHNLLFGHR